MLQRLRSYSRYLLFIVLAIVLGIVDIFLLAGATGALGKPPDTTLQALQVRQLTIRMDQIRKQIEEQKLPPTNEVENLVLSLAQVADQLNVQVRGFSGSRQVEQLGGRTYTVVDNSLELRGGVSDLVRFLDHLQNKTVATLELRNISLRTETEGWILQVQVRILTEEGTKK